MAPAIRVADLGKRYRLGQLRGAQRTLRDRLASTGRTPRSQDGWIWALRHVSFDLEPGTVLGVIGRNGAGKSTLLKILCRVTEPTEGEAEIAGRVGSLLEVGTGFHPELSGRENIYLNGAILGMRRREIDSRFDEIVDFAEVEEFLETPVKHYSSGMYLRLAFAVAAHLDPEILLVDEVLAVGDAEFQRKCLGKMGDVAQAGRTVLFVSHNMSAILRLTNQAIVMDRGSIAFHGPTPQAVDTYLASGGGRAGERDWEGDVRAVDAAPFQPLRLRVLNAAGRRSESLPSVEPITVEFEYRLASDIPGLRVGLYLATAQGEPLFASFDLDEARRFEQMPVRRAGHYRSRCRIPANWLNEGGYLVGVNASAYHIRSYFSDEHALRFSVDGTGAPGSQWPERRAGPFRPSLDWEILAEADGGHAGGH